MDILLKISRGDKVGDIDVKRFTADFETNAWDEKETYVWAWAMCEIDNEENLQIDNSIDSFIEYCKSYDNPFVYFHNLKFDGEFLIYWALKNGFKHVENKEDIEDNTFTTLISDLGQFYNITLYFEKRNKSYKKIVFYDSLKIIPFSVEQIAQSFNLPISKLKIDYKEKRERGHILTELEKEYIKNDVLIVAKALKTLFDENLNHMTQGSNALNDYKSLVKKSRFERLFPKLDYELDKELRKSYKGGFTYLNPIYKEKDVKNIVNLDVNSLYPSVMYNEILPFGEPIFFEGEYKEDKVYNLYIQVITCSFELKENKIPTIQIKNNRNYFNSNEYLENSENQIVSLVLTNVDLKLFFEHYKVYDLKFEYGWKFKGVKGIFTDYIDKWIKRKNDATLEGNKGQRTLAKLMLNALYGKFATSLDVQSKIPYLGDDDIIHYRFSEKSEKEGLYLPIGSFITAYAREKTIRTSQKIKEYSIKKYNKDMYIYSDTDSIKTLLNIEELKQFCEIDDIKLGFWKNEGIAKRGKFVRQKCYLEEFQMTKKFKGNKITNFKGYKTNKKLKLKLLRKLEITCAGLPKSCYEYVNWNNFKTGFTCGGKLTFKHIKRRSNIKRNRIYNKRRKNNKNC